MVDKEDWGPNLFSFNVGWFENKLFMPFVESVWQDLKVFGRGDYVLKEKLRMLKIRLREWNLEVYGKIDLGIKDIVKAINDEDEFVEWCCENQTEDAIRRRSTATSRMWTNIRIKENFLLQKLRLKWDLEGDANTKIFHFLIK